MTTPPSLPSLPGLAWSRHKKPGFSTRVASHVSGREVRVALMGYPLYEFEAVYDGLASSANAAFAGLGSSSLQSLMGFFLQLQGQFGTFLYTDPDDNTVTGQGVGTGDGTTASFVMGRALGGFAEPVGWVTGIANIYFNGVAQSTGSYALIAPNTLGFLNAPSTGVAITADFSYAFECRFLDDQMDFEEFMSSLWKLDSMKFRSVKSNNVPAPPPPWYMAYAISGTAPTLWADFTTEGAANDYLYNGTTYGSCAALLSALGSTFSRSSSASYINSSGLLATASTNALRFAHDPSSLAAKGLLLEGASTNLFTYSNSFSNAAWSVQQGTAVQNATGPDGIANSAWTLTATTTAGNNGVDVAYLDFASSPVTGPCTVSCWFQAGTAPYGFIMLRDGSANILGTSFNLSNGTVGTQGWIDNGSTGGFTLTDPIIQAYPNGWYRCALTFTPGSSTQLYYVYIGVSDTNGTVNQTVGKTGAIYGAQLEALPFASSYIPTTSSTATRAADSLSAASWAAITAGTLYAKADTECSGQAQRILQIDDGTANNRASLSFNASAEAEFDFVDGGTSEAALTVGTITANAAAQMAAAFQANDFALVEGGGTPATALSGSIPAFSKLRVGADSSGADNLFGHIAQIGLWNSIRGPNAILQSLT